MFGQMFPDADLGRYSKHEALKVLLRRFAYRHVLFDAEMVKSFYKLPAKEIKAAVDELINEGVLTEYESGFALASDIELLKDYNGTAVKSVFVMHKNDFLVKSNEYWLKDRFKHPKLRQDVLQYLLIDGRFRGAVFGAFRYGPYDLEGVLTDFTEAEITERGDEVLQAVYAMNGEREVGWTSVKGLTNQIFTVFLYS
jgi:hypothetical protein